MPGLHVEQACIRSARRESPRAGSQTAQFADTTSNSRFRRPRTRSRPPRTKCKFASFTASFTYFTYSSRPPRTKCKFASFTASFTYFTYSFRSEGTPFGCADLFRPEGTRRPQKFRKANFFLERSLNAPNVSLPPPLSPILHTGLRLFHLFYILLHKIRRENLCTLAQTTDTNRE